MNKLSKELQQKMSKARALLNSPVTNKEREKIEMSILAYASILNTAINPNLFNFLDRLTNGRFSQNRYKKIECLTSMVNEILVTDKAYINEQYLQFLLQLVNNVAMPYLENPNFDLMNISYDQMLNTSKNFFTSLSDAELEYYYNKIISRPNAITITSSVRLGNESFNGICNYDYINNEPYVIVMKQNDINDLYTLSHEIIHGIDFLMKPKLYSETYYGFHETATYTF